ncbi:histidine kinase/DNA gyrase B/HSP90-like ATPase [Solirubrobacter pauli]|uniref:Histidine kinase/DNA gyrase B/HSP90-like ATPase n=2 Tax=Solirubrobacter pauli TaxID=166793 RepID=A0A660KZB9_9ACTN|nr:histidine kinase/DNA gyrase B/HSP90-like ATPase [Solirubrobacter pauli]
MTSHAVDSTASRPTPSPAARRLTSALALVGACVCALAVSFVVQAAPADQRVARGVTELLVVGVPIVAGLYALGSPHTVRSGAMLLSMGFAWSLTALAESDESLPYSIGRVAAWLVFPGLILLMLTFPSGVLDRGRDRALLYALCGVLTLLFLASALFVVEFPSSTPWATCTDDCPANAFMVVDREPAIVGRFLTPARELLSVLLLSGVLVSILLRWRAATPLQRRTIWPVVIASSLSVVLLAAFFVARRRGEDASTVETLGLLWGLCIPAISAAFLAGLLRRRLLLGQVLADLAGHLSSGLDVRRVRDGLASALRDPSLEVLVADGPVHWRDSDGRVGSLPAAGSGRAVTIVGAQTAPAVALVHDTGLEADQELLGAVGSLVLGTVRHHAVAMSLAGALQQLAQSRRRIAEAADHERARIERDLHDGAQQRLMALRIRLSLAEELLTTDPKTGIGAVHELGDEVERTLDEIRALAHGVYPAVLNDRGLADALRSVAADAPLPVHVQLRRLTRHSRQVETAIYFTCVEALQNAVKHAHGASGVWIAVTQDAVLSFEIRDDGAGFTPPPETGGNVPGHIGLRNMRDRLEAVGGSLVVESAPGHGTRISGRLPLD